MTAAARDPATVLDLDLQIATAVAGLPSRGDLAGWVAAALAGRRPRAALTIRLVDEDEGLRLNLQFRGRDYATNVLSFPFEPPPGLPPEVDEGLLGDLVICAPVVAREAAEHGVAPAARWAHVVVHGTLHLLGLDHEDDIQAEAMEEIETVILHGLGFPSPYEAM